jgi:uncharacterized protein (DUF362 family)
MNIDRRHFLRNSLIGGVGLSLIKPTNLFASQPAISPLSPSDALAKVALSSGDNRADLAFRALKPFSEQIKRDIGNRRVILKPNNVIIHRQLAATHVDTLEGVLEFLKSIGITRNILIAESAATGPTLDGFENYGYMKLAAKYPGIQLIDLDAQPYEKRYVADAKDFKPHAVRFSSLLLDKNNYIVSVARMKTHGMVIATLSLKNIVFGAPIKDIGSGTGPGVTIKPGAINDKPIAHGGGIKGINFNLFVLSQILHIDLAIIDGFEGMEGNGPNDGDPVDHRICLAGPDWLATDRVGVELMGIDYSKIAYLNYCGQAGYGVDDLSKIEIIGEPLAKHKKTYKLTANIEQLILSP